MLDAHGRRTYDVVRPTCVFYVCVYIGKYSFIAE